MAFILPPHSPCADFNAVARTGTSRVLGNLSQSICFAIGLFSHSLLHVAREYLYPEAFEIVLLQDHFSCILYISKTTLSFRKVNLGNLLVRNTVVNKVKEKIHATVRLE